MATLKELDMRKKSVQSIEKITKSMKMVSAAKFARAERALKASRAIGPSSTVATDLAGVEVDDAAENQLLIAVSSDRGLCGGIHSGICRNIRAHLEALPENVNTKLVLVGDRARAIMARTHTDDILVSAANVGKNPPTFSEASEVAKEITNSGYEYGKGMVMYNHFNTAASYEVKIRPAVSAAQLAASDSLSAYEDIDDECVINYAEFNLANNIFYCQLEGATSEQSARMAAMENASKNAGEMIEALQIQYNRTRQAVVTTELIEIISGAAALE
jgi:F-type H+-transporting ATPase subunit gamma